MTIELTSRLFGKINAAVTEVRPDGQIHVAAEIKGQQFIGRYDGSQRDMKNVIFHPAMNPDWANSLSVILDDVGDEKLRRSARERFEIAVSSGLDELNALSAEATRETDEKFEQGEKLVRKHAPHLIHSSRATGEKSEWDDDQNFMPTDYPTVRGIEITNESELEN